MRSFVASTGQKGLARKRLRRSQPRLSGSSFASGTWSLESNQKLLMCASLLRAGCKQASTISWARRFNAGYGQIAPFEQISAEDFQAVVDTCFYGVVYTTRAAVPVMRKQKSGHIFQVSSVGGRIAIGGNTPYHAAKWAVGGFSDALAMEVAPFGVKVCTLEPGGIRTNWARRAGQNMPDLLPEYEASVGSIRKLLQGLEGRSEGDPRKIADVILQLANSDEVPMRLILGVDAEKRVLQAESARASEAEKWRHLTVSTVFEDGRFDSRLYKANSGINS